MVVAPPPTRHTPMRSHLARLVAAMKVAAASAIRELREPTGTEPLEAKMVLHIQIEEDALDGGYVATCLDLPGCASQGETEHEALENLVEAITGVLEVRMQRHLEEVAPGQYQLAPPGMPQRRNLELPVT